MLKKVLSNTLCRLGLHLKEDQAVLVHGYELEFCRNCKGVIIKPTKLARRPDRPYVYLAGRVGTLPSQVIDAERRFSEVANKLRKKEIVVLNPLELTFQLYQVFGDSLDYTRLVMPLILACDEVWIIPTSDVRMSSGLRSEVLLALHLDLPVRVILNLDPLAVSEPVKGFNEVVKRCLEVSSREDMGSRCVD